MPFTDVILPFNEEILAEKVGKSRTAKYLYRYLGEMKAKTVIAEPQYIDKDFLIDYQKFYSRSFKPPLPITERYHFFSEVFTPEQIATIALNENPEDSKRLLQALQASYLGFIVLKPITDDEDNRLIGRTLLKSYPEQDGQTKRHYLHCKHNVSLFGFDLQIESIPYQEQDKGVSACATIALWIVFNALQSQLKLPQKAPAEITEVSTRLPTEARVFPQGGLSIEQMITCLRSSDLDVEIIGDLNQETIVTAIKAYIDGNIPIIADLELTLKPKFRTSSRKVEYHAAVITGYHEDTDGNIVTLYVHDDQIGPYCKTKSKNKSKSNLCVWNNEWLRPESKYNKVRLEKLLVPVYHKIRLSWLEMYDFHKKYEEDAKNMECRVDLILTTVQDYKRFLRLQAVEQKAEALKHNLPRFLWVERFHKIGDAAKLQFDHVFDATDIHPSHQLTVEYTQNNA